MKRLILAVIAALSLAPAWSFAATEQSPAPPELFSVPTAEGALASSRFINEFSHYAGTPGDKRLAQWMAQRLHDAGFRVTIESFTALVPQRRRVALAMLGHPVVNLDLRESAIAGDPDGSRPDAGIPFNAWSGSGTVTARLVVAGAGLDNDYRTLAAEGISVRGKIVLVQYGAEFRGLLAARAQRNGAAGVILYSDPSGRDGSANGAAYPKGPYRPLGSVQRGSLGRGITIPVLPVSALNAERLVRANAPIRMTVDEPFERKTLWNVIGELRGRDPNQEVVLGGHRDAWVYGVSDNGDGISTLIEAAKALDALVHSGWMPQRSIVIAGWDGEEIGELGSLAYVRTHLDRLRVACVAYVNIDEGETGQRFGASAAAALASFVPDVAGTIDDPAQPQRTLLARWQAQVDGARVSSPGGGSDFESFLYDAAIPTIDWGFSGPFGVYHSAYDDIAYATRQADPGFVDHRAMAQAIALAAYRLSSDPLRALYRLAPYVETLRSDLAAIPEADRSDVGALSAAIDRFSDRASAEGASDGVLLDAVHRLNLLCYGRNGYAAVPLPDLSDAVATGDAGAIRAAAARAATVLDAVSQELGA